MDKTPIIVISGPTASGKTSLSIDIAKEYNAEIVSADSMQIYKQLDIGTAKPNMKERDGIIHHMIDIIEPDENFSVAEYVKMAHGIIKDIREKNKNAVIVGGTGLYINSLVDDIDFREDDSDENLREELNKICEEKGIDCLFEMLEKIDPVSAKRLHKNNTRRIIRAIEFYKMTGIPISKHQEETKKKVSRYDPCMIAVKWDMDKLYERIEKRVDIMIENGLENEVRNLCEKGYTKAMLSMQGIGYKEMTDYINGSCSLDEAIEKIKIGTRHYAKRQMTWFRRDDRIHWIDYRDNILERARKILKENGYITKNI